MSKSIIVTGGSGFIGTSLCKMLVAGGHNVTNIDRKKKEIEGVTQYPFDLNNHQIKGLIQLSKPDAIIHLAAEHEVERSTKEPDVYYTNNVVNSINLINYALEAGVKNFIYSGSSSVYGSAKIIPTPESSDIIPESPYARTKSIVENVLEDYNNAYPDFKYVSLRYFNAAGAMADLSHGYVQDPATHLIPLACRAAVRGDKLTVYSGMNTPDGTGKRDYTHVCDIAEAHIAALDYLDISNSVSRPFNIGRGESTSVLEIIELVNNLSDNPIDYEVVGPRAGDIPVTCAETTMAKNALNWKPKYGLTEIIMHAYEWETKQKRKKT